ncbi:MAG: penicillin-binding protein 2 [Eubacteriales bacterium]|nr:penicillin-binding protein 2 [Eubacteriales bacterium]
MNRIRYLSVIFALSLLFLMARLFHVSIINHSEYSKAVVSQFVKETDIKNARKILYDRNMIPLTESTCDSYAVILCDKCDNLEKVRRITGLDMPNSGVEIVPMPQNKRLQTELMSIKGVTQLTIPERYFKNNLFCHLIGYGGYTNGSGLEKALDNSLITNNKQKIFTTADAKNANLATQGYYNPNAIDLSGVRLTVDMHIQKICEEIMDSDLPRGAVIVTDIETGEILAMASRPAYSQDNPVAFFNKEGGQLLNRSLSSYDMGSVFKILITAIALEEGIVNPSDTFVCNGHIDIDGKDFYCNNKEGHGQTSLEEGFALSCNIPFYSLGQQLGWDKIKDYAQRIGFGNAIIDLALDESKGNLPDTADSPQALANLSIGQGNMTGTPIQIAQLLQIVGNEGIKKPLILIDGKLKSDGITFTQSPRPTEMGVFSKETTNTLLSLMEKVVTNGTGTPAKSDKITIAGKTGSAESGWQENGESMTHGWFAGVFPRENPQYACVVLCENGKWGGSGAGPIFKKIAEEISYLY